MKQLDISTGAETYSLGGKCEVSFNPTDMGFIKGIYRAFETALTMQKNYEAEAAKLGAEADAEKIFALEERFDSELRSVVDAVFNVPVCDPIFGSIDVHSQTPDGIPLWANLLMVIIDACDEDATAAVSKSKTTVDKYVSKYKKKYHK